MNPSRRPLVVLPGAGGDWEMKAFQVAIERMTDFEITCYPSWDPFIDGKFSAVELISELTQKIEAWVPAGPIRIAGYSLGGHLGYAVALNLQSRGREIAGFCAFDSAMGAHPIKRRLALIKDGQVGELFRSLISGIQTAIQGHPQARALADGPLDEHVKRNALLYRWLEDAVPWINQIDRDPAPLLIPSAHLRTWPTTADDKAWKRRCPNIQMYSLPGIHQTLFHEHNAGFLCETFMDAVRDWR